MFSEQSRRDEILAWDRSVETFRRMQSGSILKVFIQDPDDHKIASYNWFVCVVVEKIDDCTCEAIVLTTANRERIIAGKSCPRVHLKLDGTPWAVRREGSVREATSVWDR